MFCRQANWKDTKHYGKLQEKLILILAKEEALKQK